MLLRTSCDVNSSLVLFEGDLPRFFVVGPCVSALLYACGDNFPLKLSYTSSFLNLINLDILIDLAKKIV